MNVAEFVRNLLLLLATGAGLAALSPLCAALFPGVVGRARRNAELLPRRSLAVGLVNALFFGLLAAGISQGGDVAGLLALLLITAALGLAALGLAGLSLLVAERLGVGGPPALRALAGALVLCLASLTPVVGWFGVAALALLTGLGAAIIALVQRGPREAP